LQEAKVVSFTTIPVKVFCVSINHDKKNDRCNSFVQVYTFNVNKGKVNNVS
jgi:hypothetical protein